MRLALAGFVALVVLGAVPSSTGLAQQPAFRAPPEDPRKATPAPVEKLGPTTYRVGKMTVDTARREVSVPGTVNGVSVLEFVANTLGGMKAYETALTLNTNAISFNAALLLIGLDPSRGRPALLQFDPTPPEGDPLDITVDWQQAGKPRRARVEELLYDRRTKRTLPEGPWVYTGSRFVDLGVNGGRQYLAELDGVLIGFMHGPQAIIDNPRNDAAQGYGAIVLNPALGLAPETPVTLTIRALPVRGQR
jgi:hypothetical protein